MQEAVSESHKTVQDAWAERLQQQLGNDFRVVYTTKQPVDKANIKGLSIDQKTQYVNAVAHITSLKYNIMLGSRNWKAVD